MTESKSKVSTPPILIGDLPRAEKEALKAFAEIQNNSYENKSLGKQKQVEEVYPCDCQYRPGEELNSYTACGEDADCINRLTQTECDESECRSKSHCQNQRFQRKQYAGVEIVQTEHKAEQHLTSHYEIIRNDMVYEYIGEVVTENTLLRRMRAYNDEGIKHFYFMMLQKGEFIDATKRGGIGRFANHSCNPNCYVAKWVVGNRIRMAIFAKRNIVKDEELTFNYNVDRYGNDAQTCYCGEANCVGFIGGKTQTEVATMDDVYLDALGLDDDEIRALSINIPKKVKKGKKGAAAPPVPANPEEEELKFAVKPLKVEQVASLLIAIRKAIGTTRPMLLKLLGRLQLTEDLPSLRQFLRLRGLGLLAEILGDSSEDPEVATLILQSIQNLPMTNRIKIEDIGLEDTIQPYTESEDESLKTMSVELLEKWSQLEKGFRIPRKKAEDDDVPTIRHYTLDDEEVERPRKRPKVTTDFTFDLPPAAATSTPGPYILPPRWPEPTAPPRPAYHEPSKDQLEAIIARAAETAAAMAAAAQASSSTSTVKEKKHRTSDKSKSKNTEALKEKQLKKLVGSVIVKSASKYAKQLGHEAFKKYAEECTVTIAEKEKKSSTYATSKLDKLSDEKQAKIKKFAKDFFIKAVHKMEKKKASRPPSSPSKSSQPSTTDPRRSSLTGTASSSSATLQINDITPPSPNLERNGEDQPDGEEVNVEDLMDQMFGEDEEKMDDVDEEETLKADQTPDGDMDVDGDQLKIGTVENTPVGDANETNDHVPQNMKMEQDLVDLMPRVC
ncbi:histone methyltransferase set2 [Tulasnella sp. 332]|nr:histone methyltransferase set2 [Tulasnella sp. 332]